jgi:hypothetical protein
MKRVLKEFYKRFIASTLREIHRPKDIPFLAPDCGWNHGEPKPDVKRTADNEHRQNA